MYNKFADMLEQADTAIMDNDGANTIVNDITEYYIVSLLNKPVLYRKYA